MAEPLTSTSHLQHLRNLLGPIFVVLVVYALALLVFILAFGWARFVADFWPLDASRIGPNLCASFVLVLALLAHNEWVTEERARERHESHRQALEDGLNDLLHPTEEVEATIAAEEEKQFKTQVLGQLDETTPGGLGALVDLLRSRR